MMNAVEMAQFCVDNNTKCTDNRAYSETSELCISYFLQCKPLFFDKSFVRCRYCGTYNLPDEKCSYCKR